MMRLCNTINTSVEEPSYKEPHFLVEAGTVTRCGFGFGFGSNSSGSELLINGDAVFLLLRLQLEYVVVLRCCGTGTARKHNV
jgi:hypothetical protein